MAEEQSDNLTTTTDNLLQNSNDFLEPATIQAVADGDVYKNYRWSINSPRQDFIDEVPVIQLIEYQSNAGPILEDVQYNIEVLKSSVQQVISTNKPNPYLQMYNGVFTGNVYRLPFFSTYNHNISHNWATVEDKGVIDKVKDWAETGASIFQRGSIEKRRVWEGSSPANYSFEFILYNTFDQTDIPKNFQFLRSLQYNNLPSRTSFATMLPPCFYKLEIPGVRYAPVAVLNGISIDNIGQVNRKKMSIPNADNELEEIWVNIPDAYHVTISVSELHVESREIYNSTFTNKMSSKVNVMTDTTAVQGTNLNTVNVRQGGLI